jgi:hypothetical protein
VAQRLTMPDVTPRGRTVLHDLTGYLRGTTSELVAAGVAAVDSGLASRSEVRTRWLGLPADDSVTNTPTPTPSEDRP